MAKKHVLVICRATYRGVQILESDGKFMLYLGMYRHEFCALTEATTFVDTWLELKKN